MQPPKVVILLLIFFAIVVHRGEAVYEDEAGETDWYGRSCTSLLQCTAACARHCN